MHSFKFGSNNNLIMAIKWEYLMPRYTAKHNMDVGIRIRWHTVIGNSFPNSITKTMRYITL